MYVIYSSADECAIYHRRLLFDYTYLCYILFVYMLCFCVSGMLAVLLLAMRYCFYNSKKVLQKYCFFGGNAKEL